VFKPVVSLLGSSWAPSLIGVAKHGGRRRRKMQVSDGEQKRRNETPIHVELQEAYKNLRCYNGPSRNPHYHDAIRNSQARLERAITRAVKALSDEGL
jgi:hypothetical protein